MGILGGLFGKKTSNHNASKTILSKEIENVLVYLRSGDVSDRLAAMAMAARLLGGQEPGALIPYLSALRDEDAMLRGAVATQLAEAAIDEQTKDVLRRAVMDSAEGRPLMDLLKEMSEKDSEKFVREEARRALDNIHRFREK